MPYEPVLPVIGVAFAQNIRLIAAFPDAFGNDVSGKIVVVIPVVACKIAGCGIVGIRAVNAANGARCAVFLRCPVKIAVFGLERGGIAGYGVCVQIRPCQRVIAARNPV